MKKALWTITLLLAGAAFLAADVPARRENFIYSVLAFNGKDYSGTFTPEDADTLYLIAGVDNFLTAGKTLVYYWPLTGEWKIDANSLNQIFAGTLELEGPGQERQSIAAERYTYFNVRGEYELNWRVARGAQADSAWDHYQKLVGEYRQAVGLYYEAQSRHEATMNELTSRITRLRAAGRDVSALVEELKGLSAPQPPQPPRDYIVPPIPVREAFILNLPAGEYRIRFRAAGDRIMQGSEKRVVVFEKRRSDGVGFSVIPGDKWTRPIESKTPSSVLYVDGTTDLYLQPFFQDEYNDLYYAKMQRNDARGNPSLMKWVRLQQVPQARIEVTRAAGRSEVVLEEPFYVEQVKGASLGYKIVRYDPQGAHQGRDPSLRAFHIPVRRERSVIRLRALDSGGQPLPGGDRQIRVVMQNRRQILLFLLALAPLAVMAAVLSGRARRYSG